MFARGGEPPPVERVSWMERESEDFLARAGVRSRLMLSLMIWLTTLLAPLFSARFRLLYSLPVRERVTALSRLEELFGEPLLAVKAILCLIYYEHPGAARDVGFDGECLVPRDASGGKS